MAGTEILIALAVSAATSVITSALAPKQKLLPVDKGRFDDIRIQGSEYGTSIPILYGRGRLAGNVIYSDGVQPYVTTTPGRSGGKGGRGGTPATPPTNTYSYTTNIAIAICEGVVKGGLKRVWENTKVTINSDTSPLSTQSWEFESTNNVLTGGAVIVRDLSASSEYKVQFIGNSSVQVNGIVIPQTGSYDIKISYASQGIKSALLKVDTLANEVVTFPSTGSASLFSSISITKSFTIGTHSVTLSSNGSDAAPFFDAVAVVGAGVLITPTNVTGIIAPDALFPSNTSNPSQYYNARLLADNNGTAYGIASGLTPSVSEFEIDPFDPPENPPPTTTGGGSTVGGTATGNASFTFYNGSETQFPDLMMEQIEGTGNVPAYRGIAYLTFNKYQIPEGQMPNFTFEVDEGTHDLADILKSLWKRVGLQETELDVTSLVGTFVEGVVIPSRTALSDILDTLAIAFAFDFVDVNGKVTAVKRGSSSVVDIFPTDLRAHDDGGEVPVAELEGTYVNVEELPRQIDVSYLDRAKDYHQNVQPALMQIGYTEEPQTLVLPIVMTANQAHEVGLRVLNTIHLQRASFGFTLPPKFSYLAPSDVITVQMPNATHKLRIAQFQNGMLGYCKVQAVPDSASLYNQLPAGDAGGGAEIAPIQFPANTELVLMDIMPLIPEHTGYGFYAAACGKGNGDWYGAHLYREELPNSNSWERIGGFEVGGTIGTAANPLSADPVYTDIGSGNMIDVTSNITVLLYNGILESFTQAELFVNPALNLCYIGGELVQFASASAVSPSTSPYIKQYTLTNFRRGVNGTTNKIVGHGAGEQFVYINNAVKYMREQSSQLFINSRYKAVSIGQPLLGAEAVIFNPGTGSAPPAVTNLSLIQVARLSGAGVAVINIRGTFLFGSYVGGQKGKVLIKRPEDTIYYNTGILVSPDANNAGSFEVPATANGTYFIQVISVSPYDLQLPNVGLLSPHPIASIDISSSTSTTIPVAPDAPVGTLQGSMVRWVWTASTAPDHAFYRFADEFGEIIQGGNRVDSNIFLEAPQTLLRRKVLAVNNQGVPSPFSPVGEFTIAPPDPPTGYEIIFDGFQLYHTWLPQPDCTFQIANNLLAVIGNTQTNSWLETQTPEARSIVRYVRALRYGAVSDWSPGGGLTFSIPPPPAPNLVAFDEASATPYDINVIIDPPTIVGFDARLIRRTVVEVLNSVDETTPLYVIPFDGLARSASISGRFLTVATRTIRVRAYYIDFFGVGATAITTGTHTFVAITEGDIETGAIRARHLQNGIITTAAFASTIRPIRIWTVDPRPALPDTSVPPEFPEGSMIYWTIDSKTYQARNNLWVSVGASTFDDLTGTIAAAQISNGTITDNMLNAAANFSRIVRSGIQGTWNGGGSITWSSTAGLTWTQRLVSLPNALSSQGFFEFTPRNLPVTTNYFGLFRRVRIGGTGVEGDLNLITDLSTAASGYFITNYTAYTSTNALAPNGYLDYLIGYVNADTSTGTGVRFILWDGRIINNGQTIDANSSVPLRSISAEQIIAGTITSAEIKAGSITSEKFAVGLQTGNLVTNPSFEVTKADGTPDGWASSIVANGQSVVLADATDGNKVLRILASTASFVDSRAMPVSPLQSYLIRFSARGSAATATLKLQILTSSTVTAEGYLDNPVATDFPSHSAVAMTTSWGVYGSPYTSTASSAYIVPANTRYIALRFYNNVSDATFLYVDDVVVIKQFGNTYIQDGAITTDKIIAGGVTARNIQVGTFSESLQLNNRFLDGNSGYYDFNGNQIGYPVISTPAGDSPSEWQTAGVTSVRAIQVGDLSGLPPATPPSTPTNLSGTVISSSQINLTWTASTGTVTGYQLQRSTNSTFTQGLANIPIDNVTSTSQTGLSASTQYWFRISAYNSGGSSPTGNEIDRTTQAGAGGGTITPFVLMKSITSAGYMGLCTEGTKVHIVTGGYGVEPIYYYRSQDEGTTFDINGVNIGTGIAYLEEPLVMSGNKIALFYFKNVVTITDFFAPRTVGELFCKVSTDGGTNWGDEELVSGAVVAGRGLRMSAIWNGDLLHVSWMDFKNVVNPNDPANQTTSWDIYYNRRVNGVWETEQRLAISTNRTGEVRPAIACVGTNVHLVWFGGINGRPSCGFDNNTSRLPECTEVIYRRSTNNGVNGSWETKRELTNNAAPTLYSGRVNVIDIPNGIFISFDRGVTNTVPDNNIYGIRSIDNGLNFQTEYPIVTDAGTQTHSSVAYENGLTHLVWGDYGRSNNVYYRQSSDNGVTFGNEQFVLTAGIIGMVDTTTNYVHVLGDNGGGTVGYKRKALPG